MAKKYHSNLLLFSLFGITMWFFGNLYEGVVITPNLLVDSVGKVQYWQRFFTVTNPIFFYLPIAPIAVLTTIILYFKTTQENITLKKHLRYATVFLLFAFGVGIFIITRINLKIFFGEIARFSAREIYELSVLWNILNIVRVFFLALTIYQLFKAYILKIK